MLDKLKIAVAVALVAAGVWGYYRLADQGLFFRVVAVLGGVAAGAVVARFSGPGRRFAEFTSEAITEVKKVVWPTRKETVQTTAAVFGFVVVMAVFLWASDKILEWGLYSVILGWK